MLEEKLCPNCNEPIEEGAIFCGNCGHRLMTQTPQTSGQIGNVPTYSKFRIYHRKHWPAYSVIFGIVGIASSLFIPIVGLVIGIVSIILSTSSIKEKNNKKYRISGLIIGIIAVIIAILSIVISVNHKDLYNNAPSSSTNSSIYVTTPCYEIRFSTLFNFSNTNKNSCNTIAYYGPSLRQANQLYKIEATYSPSFNPTNLNTMADNAITADMATNLKGFQIISKHSTTFDNSDAYYIIADNPKSGLSVIEEIVYHPSVKTNYNIFVIVRSEFSKTINLNALKKAFVWK